MSGGDSLEHECQTSIEDISEYVRFSFLMPLSNSSDYTLQPVYKDINKMINIGININQANGQNQTAM